MSTTTANFFDMPTDQGPKREGGDPVLLDRQGVEARYTRASNLANYIETKPYFHRWEMRYLCKAMGQHEDLAALAAVETYSTGISDAVFGREKSESGKRLDSIIERAMDRVRIHEKADRGTAVHGATEPGAPAGVERLRPAAEAFWEFNRVECIELVGTEMFTVNDWTMSAGTFDHLIRVPGHEQLHGMVVADKKTGSYSPFDWAVQIASYAYGQLYNVATNERVEWPGQINLDYGFVWHIDAERATVKPYIVELKFGWRMAQIAAEVRDGQRMKGITFAYEPPTFEERLAGCETRGDLERLWYSGEFTKERQDAISAKAKAIL